MISDLVHMGVVTHVSLHVLPIQVLDSMPCHITFLSIYFHPTAPLNCHYLLYFPLLPSVLLSVCLYLYTNYKTTYLTNMIYVFQYLNFSFCTLFLNSWDYCAYLDQFPVAYHCNLHLLQLFHFQYSPILFPFVHFLMFLLWQHFHLLALDKKNISSYFMYPFPW